MKKLFIFALAALMLAACGDQSKKDKDDEETSSERVDNISQADADARDRELDELLAIYNDVTEAMQQINEAQGRVVIAQQGERANRRQLIQEDMKFIQEKLAENAELIQKLRDQLANTDIKSKQLKRTIDDLMSQLQSKTQEIQRLRDELEAKDIHIAELDRQLESLNENIDQLNENVNTLQDTNAQQDQQLHAAWYAVGSKSELKDHRILKSGRVLEGEYDASFFKQIDIRQLTTLPLYSKKAEILTSHPAGSYSLERDANRQYVLQILDPQRFWSASKYLVIQIK